MYFQEFNNFSENFRKKSLDNIILNIDKNIKFNPESIKDYFNDLKNFINKFLEDKNLPKKTKEKLISFKNKID
jgi:hypothetical protein